MTRKRSAIKANPLAERMARQETLTDGLLSDVTEMKDALKEIQTALTKYRGFWGGITLMITAVVTFFTIAWDTIATKLGWK